MKKHLILLLLAGSLSAFSSSRAAYQPSSALFPFAFEVGDPSSTALPAASTLFKGWATEVTQITYGSAVDAVWKTPQKALGAATGDAFDVVTLGNGGSITVTFAQPIMNGNGWDFAVFENPFGDYFLELAFLEVSSDGVHFVRFPNYSYTAFPVGTYSDVNPAEVYGFASKYRAGYGTPFDLQELQDAYTAAVAGQSAFSSTFKNALIANFPFLDLSDVRFVRIIDITGNGTSYDAEGRPIYDPHPTTGSGGFDLEALGVIHPYAAPATFQEWASARLTSGATESGDLNANGIPDYIEFAFNSDGKAFLNASDLGITLDPATGNLTVNARVNAASLSRVVFEYTSSLSPNGGGWTPLSLSEGSLSGGMKTVTGSASASGGAVFMRVRYKP